MCPDRLRPLDDHLVDCVAQRRRETRPIPRDLGRHGPCSREVLEMGLHDDPLGRPGDRNPDVGELVPVRLDAVVAELAVPGRGRHPATRG